MRTLLFLAFLFILASCSIPNPETEQLNYALQKAGYNRSELEKVIEHYKGDSLKREAACFLIRNMVYHFGYNGRERVEDITSVSADYLINNIDLAFQIWPKPWNKTVSFEDFCRYILPYRAIYEPPHTLRKEFMETYVPLLDSLQIDDTFEANSILQKKLKQTVAYVNITSINYPTVEEIHLTGNAKCDGLAMYGVNVMRAAGIPATTEYTVWSRRDGEHYWCTFLNQDGKFYPFSPNDEGPDMLRRNLTNPFVTPAKVYRLEFAPLHPIQIKSTDNYRTFLKNPTLTAVTEQFLAPVADITTTCDFPASSAKGLVYLCTFNNNNWRPFALSERNGEECVFTNIVGDDIFIIAEYNERSGTQLHYLTYPFYMDKKGNITKIKADPLRKGTLFIASAKPGQQEVPRSINLWVPEKESFTILNTVIDSISGGLHINDIPQGALFKALISLPGQQPQDRIFIINNDTIKRY